MASGSCSECKKSLAEFKVGTKTCSRSCREKRSRRLTRARKLGGSESPYSPEVRAVALAARRDAKNIVPDLVLSEALPIIREQLTDEVVKSLGSMLALVPAAIAAIKEDVSNPDPMVHQRASELVMRYTLGHKSIAPPSQDVAPAPMTVNLLIPGSGSDPDLALDVSMPGEADEIKECIECRSHKPAPDFVAGSDRCTACDDAFRTKVTERFG